MFRLSDLRHVLHRLGEPYKPRAERSPAIGLKALVGLGSAFSPACIKDFSASGIYLLTQERFHPGDLAELILRKEGEPDVGSDLQISLQGRVARPVEDGVVLAFVLPPGTDAELFSVLLRGIASLTDPDQCAEMFRTLRTVLFLCRLCGPEAEEAILLFDGRFDADHTANLFKIALTVEKQLACEPDAGRMHCHPKVVAGILRHGSWAPDEMIMQLWVGLFVSSCTTDEPVDSNQALVDLLVQVTPTQARVLIHACERVLASAQGTANSGSRSVVLSPSEIVQLTGVYDLTRNATDLAYLFNLGLIEKVFDFTSYHDIDSIDITPTSLGLELYKHCHGTRENLEPQLVESAREHLALFLPPPIPSAVADHTSGSAMADVSHQ